MSAVDIFRKKWNEIRAAVKERWGDKITDADLDRIAGQHEQLCHLLGEKCGLSERRAREEVNKILDSVQLGSGYL